MAVLLTPCASLHEPLIALARHASDLDGRFALYRVMRHGLETLNELGLTFKKAPYLARLVDQSDLLFTVATGFTLIGYFFHTKEDDVELVRMQDGRIARTETPGPARTAFVRAIEQRWLRAVGMVCIAWTCFTCLDKMLKNCQINLMAKFCSSLGQMGSFGERAAKVVTVYYPNSGIVMLQIGTAFLALAKVVDVLRKYHEGDTVTKDELVETISRIAAALLENFKVWYKSPMVSYLGLATGLFNLYSLHLNHREKEAKNQRQHQLWHQLRLEQQGQ